MKPFITPDTSGWVLNVLYLKKALEQLGLEMFKGINVIINFKDLSLFTLQLLNTDVKKVFVIPEWHCAPWYKPLHGILRKKKNSVQLPNVPDLFLDAHGNPLEVFSYSHTLFATANSTDFPKGEHSYVSFSSSSTKIQFFGSFRQGGV